MSVFDYELIHTSDSKRLTHKSQSEISGNLIFDPDAIISPKMSIDRARTGFSKCIFILFMLSIGNITHTEPCSCFCHVFATILV